MTSILRAYRYRLRPTKQQMESFAQHFGCVRFIWNKMLEDKIQHYKEFEEMLKNTPAQYKELYEWLAKVDSLALCNVQLDLEKAYRDFIKGLFGFPNFKKKGHEASYTTNNQINKKTGLGTVRFENGCIRLPIVGFVRVAQHRRINGVIRSATITQEADGRYYVSVLVKESMRPMPKTNSAVGVDLGLTHLAILSNGEKINHPKTLKRFEEKLAKEQRILSRRREGAKKLNKRLSEARNYQKQRIKVAKLHKKIANIRNDILHKLSRDLVNNHDLIAVETLNVKGMVKNRRLAKAISDSGWYRFTTILEYKCLWYGKELVKIDQWYPSSKTCSSCDHKLTKDELTLNVRDWQCPQCHAEHDRDINASINILKQGIELSKNKNRWDSGVSSVNLHSHCSDFSFVTSSKCTTQKRSKQALVAEATNHHLEATFL